MAYRALYRIYRPSSFDEVAGQSHITDVLRNQVQLGRLSHAYLFCGPRGTGKTTMAKILSRACNCLSPINGEPCGACEMCRISSGVNADIMEIDAASNNGVDNVRDLIDQAQFAPLQLKKRVFIVDEVHMLSQSAFNALLKTLEEPPEHVLFILATTEPDKLLATVISRCQRFDFKRLTMPDIVEYMDKVLKKEGISAEKDALRAIAHAADGGMRDALSLLNQCISVSGAVLSKESVREVLGSVEEDLLFSLTEKILIGDGAGCLKLIDDVVREGKDLGVLLKDLSFHIRSLLLTSVCGRCADLLEITEESAARYEKQAKAVSKEQLLYFSEELIKTRSSIRYFPNPRLLLETALLRLACPSGERETEAILSRLSSLEEKCENGVFMRPSVTCLQAPEEYGNGQPVNNKTSESEQDAPFFAAEDMYSEPACPPYDDEPPFAYFEPASCCDSSFVPEEPKPIPHEETAKATPDYPKEDAQENADAYKPPRKEHKPQPSDKAVEQIYARFKAALQKINVLSTMALSSIRGKELVEDRLILYYDADNGKAILLTRQPLLGQLQAAAETVKPGLKVLLQEQKNTELSAEDEHLRELFGDKLTIEN